MTSIVRVLAPSASERRRRGENVEETEAGGGVLTGMRKWRRGGVICA